MSKPSFPARIPDILAGFAQDECKRTERRRAEKMEHTLP
jgi:hypothetical protein